MNYKSRGPSEFVHLIYISTKAFIHLKWNQFNCWHLCTPSSNKNMFNKYKSKATANCLIRKFQGMTKYDHSEEKLLPSRIFIFSGLSRYDCILRCRSIINLTISGTRSWISRRWSLSWLSGDQFRKYFWLVGSFLFLLWVVLISNVVQIK